MEKKRNEDEYISKLHTMPSHQLPPEARNRVLLAIRDKRKSKAARNYYKYSWIAVACLLIFSGIYFSDIFTKETPGTIKEPTKKIQISQEGVYFDRKDRSGEPIPEKILGIPDKIGLFGIFEDWVALDSQNVAKIFVYLWGEPEQLVDQSLKVIAEHTRTGEKVTVANGMTSSPINKEDASFLSSFAPLPYAGVWNLHFMVAEEPFADFSITVKEPFPQTEKVIIRRLPDEFKMNDSETIEIVVLKGDRPKSVEVSLKSMETGEELVETFENSGHIDASGNGQAYYWGTLGFPSKGEWSITVQGDTLHLDVQ